jgi:hypothetical protein
MLVRVMAAWRACEEGEEARPGRRAGALDRQIGAVAKSSSGTDAGARESSAVHGRANERACARCRTRVRAVGWRG